MPRSESMAYAETRKEISMLGERLDRHMTSAQRQQTELEHRVGQEISDTTAFLGQRIDNIIAHNNDTEGNTELIDIRTSAKGRIYASAGEAVRGQVNALSDDIALLLRNSRNLIDPDSIIQGAYINQHGELKSNEALCVTGSIPVFSGQEYTLSAGQTPGLFAYVTIFDNNDTVASHVTVNSSDMLTGYCFIPAADGYVRISCPVTAPENELQLEKGDEKTAFEAYGKSFIADIHEPAKRLELLSYGNVSVGATSFARTGAQLLDPDSAEDGCRYSNVSGVRISDEGYCAFTVHAVPDEVYTLSGCIGTIIFRNHMGVFLSGIAVADALTARTFTVPENAGSMTISIPVTAVGNTAMLCSGSIAQEYEDYYVSIPSLRADYAKIDDTSESLTAAWSGKKTADMIASMHSTEIYGFPYIHNGKVCCNSDSADLTAWYAGIDCGQRVDCIRAGWVWEEGEQSGAVALIINPNGIGRIGNITDSSLHLVITAKHLKLEVLGEKYGSKFYQTLIDQELSPMSLDGETVHSVVLTVSDANNSCNVNLDGVSYSGQFLPDAIISGLNQVTGRYATFEHYCDGNRESKAMPMFTHFSAKHGDSWLVYDNFDRQDGQLSTTPRGQQYVLLNTRPYV